MSKANRKWLEIQILWDDGSITKWTPESLAKIRSIASDFIDMVLRQAEPNRYRPSD